MKAFILLKNVQYPFKFLPFDLIKRSRLEA